MCTPSFDSPTVFAGLLDAERGGGFSVRPAAEQHGRLLAQLTRQVDLSGRWPAAVRRSALTLKLMTSRRFGSLIAAPTLGIPEAPGGVRNWDYRYIWIPDSAFVLYALIRLAYTGEAQAFMGWLVERCRDLAENEQLQPVYGFDGRKRITETELDHLTGYGGASPVRVGNQAHEQLQLDSYGATRA